MAIGDITAIIDTAHVVSGVWGNWGSLCRLGTTDFYALAFCDGYSRDGHLGIIEVSADGSSITWIDDTEFDTVNGTGVDISCIRCDSVCYIAMVYLDSNYSNYGSRCKTYEINPSTGAIVGEVSSSSLMNIGWRYPRIIRIDTDNWVVTYTEGYSTNFRASTFEILNSNGIIGTIHDTEDLCTPGTEYYSHAVIDMGSNIYLSCYYSVYPGPSGSACCSFHVDPSTYNITVRETEVDLSLDISSPPTWTCNGIWGCKVNTNQAVFAFPEKSVPYNGRVVSVSMAADGTSITLDDDITTSACNWVRRVSSPLDELCVLVYAYSNRLYVRTLNIAGDGTITSLDGPTYITGWNDGDYTHPAQVECENAGVHFICSTNKSSGAVTLATFEIDVGAGGTAWTKDLSDSPPFSDLLSSLSGIARYGTILDILSITEKQLYDLSGAKLLMMTDNAQLSDTRVSDIVSNILDNASMLDSKVSDIISSIEDTEEMSDTITTISSVIRSFSDNATVSELISKEPGKILGEVMSLLESYTKDIEKGEDEDLAIAETINKDIAKPLSEALAITDLYLYYRRIFTELELSSELDTDIILNVDD